MKLILHMVFCKFITRIAVLCAVLFGTFTVSYAQVTTSTISGQVKDTNGENLIGATVKVTHVPSGTVSGTVTNENGFYVVPAVRVGGPFEVVVTYTGYQELKQGNIFTSLGTAADVDFELSEDAITIEGGAEIVVSRSDLFSSNRTGAATTFSKDVVTSLPTIGSRSINSITKYNPNGDGASFGGQDSRLNNFTIDGSVFNNAFGLGSDAQAGGRTGSTAISLDAIEEVQVNVAPYDVRQTGFIGAGINAVTRSGSNDFQGSAYRNWRTSEDLFIGKEIGGKEVAVGTFDEEVLGARIGGPIIKNKVFFFANIETVTNTQPATEWVASGSTNPGRVSRVLQSDLDALSDYMRTNYQYETGPYEAFNNDNSSLKYLARLDFNLSDKHKLTVRYVHHDSDAEINISNSASLGTGNRISNFNSMAYENSGYIIQDNTRSIVGELNSTLGTKIFNNFIVGFDKQVENREYRGAFFPTIDILNGGTTYISLGFDPFTPDNLLDYSTFHVTDNLTFYSNKHTVTVGANFETYKSNNNFFPGSNGVYVFNSLADFYAASDFALKNPTADTTNTTLNRFQYRYSALPGAAQPLQVLETVKFDLYAQDEFQVVDNFKLTLGLRASVIAFDDTALENPAVTTQTYYDIDENPNYKINTGEMPKTQYLFEPRLGFNWDVAGNKTTQVRGGAGIFTGRPPYVWISNQIGNNGVLTGFIDARNTKGFAFTPDATRFIPETPTLPSTIEIAYTDSDFKFPQIFKANLAIDQKLPLGFVGSIELLLNKNINQGIYWNANLEPATTTFTGTDNRSRFPGAGVTGAGLNPAIRLNDNVSSAVVLANTNEGGLTQAVFKLEYPAKKGLYGMFAYTYSQAKDLMSLGSIAFGAWAGVPTVNGNNNLTLDYSSNDIPHRFIGVLSYKINYGGKFGGTTGFSVGYVGEKSARFSYVFGGDMNGDGLFGNDLIYVPQNASELKFEQFTVTENGATLTFTPEQQATALNAYIDQDEYLSERRGQYAERNGAIRPFLNRFDLSITQDVFIKLGKAGKRNALQFRLDMINAGNFINDEWGVGNTVNATQLLSYRRLDADQPVYRLATQRDENNNTILIKNTFVPTLSIANVWRMQFGVRYTFGE